MQVFDEIERTEMRPGRNTEGHFTYINHSARPSFVAIRVLIEDWFSHYPAEGKNDLRSRLRCKNDHQFAGAFFELLLHEYLTRLGYELQAHPEIAGETTHPDFLVRRNGLPVFYLEAIVPQNRQISPGDADRLNQIHDALQHINSPDFFLWVQHSGYPNSVPSLKPLIRKLENWLEGLNYEEILQSCHGSPSFARLTVYQTEIAGMTLSFQPFPKSEAARNKPRLRPIGSFAAAEAKVIDTTTTVRRAVLAKSKKYGNLHLPYVLAVNITEIFVDLDDAVAALFGREVIEVSSTIDGSVHSRFLRVSDGSWTTERGSVHDNISAVLFWSGVYPWNLATVEPVLIHHPFPVRPFAANISVKQMMIDSTMGTWRATDETACLATVLNLPSPWPVEDKNN